MATSWETTPDGLTWTFHLRDAEWSDGVPVTADDFVFSPAPAAGSEDGLANTPTCCIFIKNAEAVNDGKVPLDRAGRRAPSTTAPCS